MNAFRICLAISTIIIFWVTFIAVMGHGVIWPKTFLGDLFAGNWRSQFNTDLVIHLALVGWWVAWREGFGVKAYIFGIFCVIWGGMFTFPYLLFATLKAKGNFQQIFFGTRGAHVAEF